MNSQFENDLGKSVASPKKTVRIIALVVAVCLVGFAVLLATRKPVNMQTVPSPLINKPAPPISGAALDGQPVSLASYSGRFVLVNFFASWCTPCHDEEKALVTFASTNKDVSVLGVAYDDAASSAKGFLSEYGAKYQAIADLNGQVALAYGVSEPPQSYLISPNGVILTEIVGPVNLASLDQLISIAKSKVGS